MQQHSEHIHIRLATQHHKQPITITKIQINYSVQYINSFIHSIDMCRMRWFLAILRSFFHSSLLYTLSFYPIPTSPPSSYISSLHLFLGLPLILFVLKFKRNTFLGILFSSILCTCPNEHNLFNLIVSVIAGFLNHCINFFFG